jgi:quinoprotein glucose dehydrogenase
MRMSTGAGVVLFVAAAALARTPPHARADAEAPPVAPEREWRTHGGDPGHTQHSPLAAIHRGNVARLKVAWSYKTGDARPEGRSQIQCNPIVVEGVLYATSAGLHAFALDAATGRELWRFDPTSAGAGGGLGVNRGVVFWSDGHERRILYSAGQTLFALDAATGRLVPGFGRGGRVDLGEGLGRDLAGAYVRATTPGVVYHDLLILGSAVGEGPGPSAPGHVRAFDVRTGAVRWTFRTIPQPGEYGHDTWPPDAWKTAGGANSWSGLSLDHARGLVFVPTGSPAFDFWGGDRKGANLFGNCLVALRAATGERVWHYQLVRHDLWDRDLPQAPVLLDVRRDGRTIDAVAQATKSGHVFVFDRASGAPLFEIEERRVPGSDLLGEETARAQPLPLRPPAFARQAFGEADATDISPASRAAVLGRLRQVRSAGQFVPPSTQGTVIFPGFDGGAEWGGSAFDPETRLLYVNANEMAWILEMREVRADGLTLGARAYAQHCAVCHGATRQGAPQAQSPPLVGLEARQASGDTLAIIEKGKGVMPGFPFLSPAERAAVTSFARGEREPEAPDAEAARAGRPYAHLGYNRFLDPEGYPAVKPPWGTLNAIDLDSGEIRWSVPLGELEELRRRGIPRTGTENYGGPIVTAGGLVFIAATKDEKLRAFDKWTGEVLWETTLPAGGYATPATYEAAGRQYLVIAAGGGKMGTKSGDAYVAFALPD